MAASASVTLYLDELAEFHSLDIQCRFLLFVDSTSAISNIQQLKDLIPKRRFSDKADILTTLSAAHPVISRVTLSHVKSHQDARTEISKLPFSAQLNVCCDEMATTQLNRQALHPSECTISNPPSRLDILS